MKRFLALAALVLGLAACQTEPEGLDVNVGGEFDTTITVSLPETTRANSAEGAFDNVVGSDEYTIRYIFQVFYNGTESQAARQVIYTDNDRVSFPVRLVPDRHYNFVVWADVTTTAGKTLDTIHKLTIAEATAADIHYNTADLKSVAIIDDSWVAMDETRDAFTGQFNTAKDGDKTVYNSAKSINIPLTRPFAKLRVITTDMEQLNDLRISPTYATVEYTKPLYLSFNACDGEVNDETSAAPHKTHYQYTIKTDYEYNFNNDEPKVLFTDYLFAPDYDHEVNFILTVYDQHGKGTENVIKSTNFNTPIPAHRNHLTTIKGNILTEGNDITVDVSKDFVNEHDPADNPHEYAAVTNGFELVKAYYEGKKIVMLNPIVVTQADIDQYLATRSAPAIFPEMNLNGFTLTFVNNTNQPLLTLPEGSSLTISGGEIILEGTGEGAAIENNGTLTIIDTEVNSSNNGAVVENNGEATISGSELNSGALVNNGEATISSSELNDGALVNNQEGSANISGSELNEGAVENNGAANIEGSELAAGSVENNGQANVSGGTVDNNAIENGEGAIVGSYSTEDLQRAINNAKVGEPNVFTLKGDVTGDITVSQKENINITIDGDGFKYDGVIYVDGNGRSEGAETLLIQNVNFESATNKNFINADDASTENRYQHNITVKNCTFTALDGADKVVAICSRQAYDITVEDCEATNVHSFGQFVSSTRITVNKVKVNGLSGFNFGNAVHGATITNCEIEATEADGYGIRIAASVANTVNVSGCTISAFRPIVLRSAIADFKLNLENNTLTPTDKYHIYVESGVLPTTLTDPDDLIVYPRDVVSSWDEFTAALAKNNKNIVLTADITYDANYQLQKDVVIDLNGKSMTLPMINIHKNVTIKNGTINGKMYARTGCKATLEGLTFSGTISDDLSTEGHLQVQGSCDVYAKNCTFAATTVNGSQTRSLSIEGSSSGIRKFEGCDFKFVSWGTGAGKYKKNVYINTMNGTTTVDFTDCKLNGKAPNIIFAAAYPLTNLTMSGCDNTAPTLEINRAKDTVTEVEWAHISSLIANNKFTQVRVFYAGGSSEYIR